MNVNYNHEKKEKICFDKVKVGLCFIYQEEAWLKVSFLVKEKSRFPERYNAVNLETGERKSFSALDAVILPKSVVLNVEY